MEIKFILSDLDGVIRKYPNERNLKIEEKFGLPQGSLVKSAFQTPFLEKAVCGHISDENWREEIEKNLTLLSSPEVSRLAMLEWNDFSGIVDYEYLNFLEVRFPKIPVAVLTNGTSRLKSDLSKLNLNDQFFKIFNSADIGFCKPNPKIFHHVVEKLNCKPSEILFIDDSLSHVQAAKELGMKVCHYNSLGDLEKTRKDIGSAVAEFIPSVIAKLDISNSDTLKKSFIIQ